MGAGAMDVLIPAGHRQLYAAWTCPEEAHGVVLFAHGSGSGRFSPRNQFVARVLQKAGFATLLLDLLDETEADDRAKVFDIDLLASRMVAAIDWASSEDQAKMLPIGLFGASTGSAAALVAAAQRPDVVRAVVSRGGRPDLAWKILPDVQAPTLLIVGERDAEVRQLNRGARRRLGGPSELRVVPTATHLFEEPGTLQRVAVLAAEWFLDHLVTGVPRESAPRSFVDRADAARRLAAQLHGRTFTDPLVLAIPRGGVVLGAILAEALDAELDVVLSRKLRMPGQPEYALGAIAESGEVYLNAVGPDFPPDLKNYVDQECRHQTDEIRRRRSLFRQEREPARVSGRSVIVVDDGIATGSTMIAALRTLRQQNPLELIVAVPVASPDRLHQVEAECDEAVCLIEAPELQAVGQFYQDFTQVEDEEVVSVLNRFAGQSCEAH